MVPGTGDRPWRPSFGWWVTGEGAGNCDRAPVDLSALPQNQGQSLAVNLLSLVIERTITGAFLV